MQTFKFTGRIFPNDEKILIVKEIPKIIYTIQPINQTISYLISIENSIVTVRCEIDLYKEENLGYYLDYASDFVRTIVQLYSFSLGIYFDVFLNRVITPNNIECNFSKNGYLKDSCKSFSIENTSGFHLALNLVRKEPQLFLSIS